MPEPVGFGQRLAQHAISRPDEVAIEFISLNYKRTQISWKQLESATNRLARLIQARGGTKGSMVVVALRNSIEHYSLALAAWKVGACVITLNPEAPKPERDRILGLVHAPLLVGDWSDSRPLGALTVSDLVEASRFSDAQLQPVVSEPGLAVPTGGSSGSPKLVLRLGPWIRKPGEFTALEQLAGLEPFQRQLVLGPLFHNAPFTWSHAGLFEGHRLTVMERFDPLLAAELLESEAIEFAFMVPTMMARIARTPGIAGRDLSHINSIFHAGGPCPAWVKRAWMDLLTPSKIREGFGPSEGFSTTVIRGDEWLKHPGSVGRPQMCEIRILDDDLQPVPVGTVGEIFGRPLNQEQAAYVYIGAPAAKSATDGFFSAGDLGWIDSEGYLYIADRRSDLILRGGANVYPAEVEGALSEHPDIADVAVIGLPHPDLGRTVHAIIQMAAERQPLSADVLDEWVRSRLAGYKAPSSYEYVRNLPRDDAGKLRRTKLAAEWGPSERNVLRPRRNLGAQQARSR